ncbi:DUF5316 family protein [Caldifermentibacillus hisashii]|uniref:DUF5316 family protein n=1 Tax=Caldifermentibacillus hisashii TaxID=996558 RepID=UPI0022B99DC8|nr:DUF5316 family protein [Caldifermentibacillus hisashii]
MLKFSFTMGIVFIVISAIFNGALVDGQQQRGNFFSETDEHRKFRMGIATYSGSLGIVFLLIAAFIYFF